MIKYVQTDESNNITTYGDEPLPGAVAVEAPDDFTSYVGLKYKLEGDQLVVRAGWTDPEHEA